MISVAPIGLKSLQGRRVILERSTPEHAPFLLQCYQNDEFMDLYSLAQNRGQTEEQIRERLAKDQEILPQHLKRIEWIIHHWHDNGEKQPFGIASLADYRPTHRRAELLIGISSSKYRASGISLEAGLLVLDFAFNQVYLNKLVSYVYGYNDYAQTNTLSFGFAQEGFLHKHIFFPDRGFLDVFLNGLVEEDFRTNQRLKAFSQRLLGWDITRKPVPPKILSAEQIEQAKEPLRKILSGNRG